MTMLFFQFFQGLVSKKAKVTVEMKNDLCVEGDIVAVDQFLNIRLNNVNVSDPDKYPHLLALKNVFIRGSVLRYVHLEKEDVDTAQLQEASIKEAEKASEEATAVAVRA